MRSLIANINYSSGTQNSQKRGGNAIKMLLKTQKPLIKSENPKQNKLH